MVLSAFYRGAHWSSIKSKHLEYRDSNLDPPISRTPAPPIQAIFSWNCLSHCIFPRPPSSLLPWWEILSRSQISAQPHYHSPDSVKQLFPIQLTFQNSFPWWVLVRQRAINDACASCGDWLQEKRSIWLFLVPNSKLLERTKCLLG